MTATITFCGGAGTVTGANFLFETGALKTLVDCGSLEAADSVTTLGFSKVGAPAKKMSAQEHLCDTANLAAFPYDPSSIDLLIVTHAHADHIGRIPRLVRSGFGGSIHSTYATKDLAALMFEDALAVMREHAEKYGCEMLYGEADVARALSLWAGHDYHESFTIGDGITVELLDAGHILGSSLVKFTRGEAIAMFSGDLGNQPEPLLAGTESSAGAQYLVMESVYGDRVHEDQANRRAILKDAIDFVRAQKGTLLIPSFSLERTQVLLFELSEMMAAGEVAPIPVYLDAPLAIRATEVFRKYTNLFNEHARGHFDAGKDGFTFPGLHVALHTGDSRHIHKEASPKIIIAGAGMSGGGRIRAHEVEYLADPHSMVLFVGFQAPGTLGRRIQDGASTVVIDYEHLHIKARIGSLSGYSGHADRDQLLAFVENAAPTLKKVFVTMGEPRASLYLAQRIRDFYGIEAAVPERGESHSIDF